MSCLPTPVNEHTPPRAGDLRDSQADTSRLQELLPSIQPIPLREGPHRTVDWYRGHLASMG